MLSFLTEVTGAIAQTSARRPIQFMVIPALLASIAYLSIIDDYIPEHIKSSSGSSGISYYHPYTSSHYKSQPDLDKWTAIDKEHINDDIYTS